MRFDHLDPEGGEPPAELTEHFQGRARLQPFPSPFAGGPAVFAVHFEAGGRTRPHTHAAGQVLHVTRGRGVVANRDGRRTVGPGDLVVVDPGEWHWHGATPGEPMTHLTVQMTGPDTIDWDVEEADWAEDYEA